MKDKKSKSTDSSKRDAKIQKAQDKKKLRKQIRRGGK